MDGSKLHALGDMVTTDPRLGEAFAQVRRVARTEEPVLVLGETGVGKEGIARSLHLGSSRARGPFEALNCAVLGGDLARSELFGHERGAFTGAERRRPGVFERAVGGTVFLDEVGELKPEVQAQLLRVLETRRVRRVGADTGRHCDFRLVCATHRNLLADVETGRFRRDLFYRLGVIVLEVPPLRDRPHDIDLLAKRFLSSRAPRARLSDAAVSALRARPWPGNVRELGNVIRRAAALAEGLVVGPHDLERGAAPAAMATSTAPGHGGPVRVGGRPLSDVRRDIICYEVRRQRGNVTQAARVLGVARSTVYEALRAASIIDRAVV